MLTVLGTFNATLTWKGTTTVQRIYVLPASTTSLLGFHAILALVVVRFADALTSSEGPQQHTPLCRDILDGLGELRDKYGHSSRTRDMTLFVEHAKKGSPSTP